ncbi:MAG: GvpL/GvpF family gas vesicle protein [Chromatiaceae bacterium]|nr:GvpL/GvpF family gas vesicle protein [Chromatiaceae bacterium]MCF8017569.1 GvpL/GvpF family gas vesicle protein [Chromatiaceae bacterium]
MARNVKSQGGKFIYALVDVGEESPAYRVTGLNKERVYGINVGNIGAVVSDIQSGRVRPERRHLMAHRAVLAHLLELGSVLPMRFGTIASSSPAVQALLSSNRVAIEEQLQRVRQRVEMGLRVSWDVGNIYEYFVSMHPILREMRDYVMQEEHNRREEKIELGRMFDRLVQEERERHTAAVIEVLRGYCEEVVANPTKHEKEVMNLACLVDKAGQAEFEKGVFQASKRFNNDFLFDYNGPWAPHNFVDLDLQTPSQSANRAAVG